MITWIHRINVIITILDKTTINTIWTMIAPNGNDEITSFGVSLSQSGLSPETHTGISTAATEEMMLLITETYATELESGFISQFSSYAL